MKVLFAITLLSALICRWEGVQAQAIDFRRPLAEQLPHGTPFARKSSDCNALQMQWTSFRRQITDGHQQCLESNSGKRNAKSGNECIFAACEDLHNWTSSPQLQEIQRAQLRQCGESVAAYQQAVRSNSASAGSFLQPREKPWELPQIAARRHLSEKQKADLERTIEHWVNLPARRREELLRLAEISDEEWESLLDLANPIDGRDELIILIEMSQLMNQWMKRRLATANKRERRQMCKIWFPRGINLPSSCR